MIKSISTRDARYPIGSGHGSDAIHKDPIYSYAVTLLQDDQGRTGSGLAFTLGEGNQLFCEAAKFYAYTAEDIRFTTKNGNLYAYLMAWPADGRVLVRSLAEGAGKILEVSLLGGREKLKWMQTPAGLEVKLPAQHPCQFAYCLKISGGLLKAVLTK